MANNNLADILSRPATEFEPPPPLPAGGYHCVVLTLPEEITSSKKQTPGYRFTLKILSADDDVDTDELEEIGGVEDKTIRNDIWVTPASAFMLRRFLEHCGIEAEGKTLAEMLDEVPNKEVMVYMRPEADGRGGMRSVIANTAPVED